MLFIQFLCWNTFLFRDINLSRTTEVTRGGKVEVVIALSFLQSLLCPGPSSVYLFGKCLRMILPSLSCRAGIKQRHTWSCNVTSGVVYKGVSDIWGASIFSFSHPTIYPSTPNAPRSDVHVPSPSLIENSVFTKWLNILIDTSGNLLRVIFNFHHQCTMSSWQWHGIINYF